MANIKSAKKRARQSIDRRDRNMGARSMLRTYIKKLLATIESGNAEQAKAEYQETVSIIDKSVQKGIIHANKAARHKSRLSKKIAALS